MQSHASDWHSPHPLSVVKHCLCEQASLLNSPSLFFFYSFKSVYISLFYLFVILFLFFCFQALKAGSAQKNRLPTSPSILLTPALFLYHFQPLQFPQSGLLLLLVLSALVEVLHHHTDKHVEDKEADDEQEGDEVEEHPGVVVPHRLRREEESEGHWFLSFFCIKT